MPCKRPLTACTRRGYGGPLKITSEYVLPDNPPMNRRRALMGLASTGALLAVSRHADAQDPFSRSKDKVVALVRASPGMNPKLRPIQRIEAIAMKPEGGSSASDLPVFDHFVGDLHLRYVFDDPRFVQALRARDLVRLRVDRSDLPGLVVANYRKLYPDLTVIEPEPGLGVIIKGGELEPTVLLDADFWNDQTKRAGGPLIAAVPERDQVLFTKAEPKQNIELLKHRVVGAFEKAGKQALSNTVLAWRDGRWEVVA